MEEERKNLVDIWEDHVDIKDLSIAMGLCILFALGGYLIAPGNGPQSLIFGILGGVLGFIISSIMIKPKRTIIETWEDE
ncbi:hypothetical protein ACDI16_15530 [Oceanobacillus caeni]